VVGVNGVVYVGPPTGFIDRDKTKPWPEGWKKITKKRPPGGKYPGSLDSYWITPKKKYRFRSMVEVREFVAAMESHGGDEEKARAEINARKPKKTKQSKLNLADLAKGGGMAAGKGSQRTAGTADAVNTKRENSSGGSNNDGDSLQREAKKAKTTTAADQAKTKKPRGTRKRSASPPPKRKTPSTIRGDLIAAIVGTVQTKQMGISSANIYKVAGVECP